MNEGLITVDISNHPDFPGLTRKVILKSYVHDDESKLIVVNCDCVFLKDGVEFTNRAIKRFRRTLRADMATMCNPANGVVCESSQVNVGTEEEPIMETVWTDKLGNVVASPVTLYDFYTTTLKTTTLNIITLITNVITAEDQIYNGFN